MDFFLKKLSFYYNTYATFMLKSGSLPALLSVHGFQRPRQHLAHLAHLAHLEFPGRNHHTVSDEVRWWNSVLLPGGISFPPRSPILFPERWSVYLRHALENLVFQRVLEGLERERRRILINPRLLRNGCGKKRGLKKTSWELKSTLLTRAS